MNQWRPPAPRAQGCFRLWIGPRAVPARSAQEQAKALGIPERPVAVVAAASRDGSRSEEFDAALRPASFGATPVRPGSAPAKDTRSSTALSRSTPRAGAALPN